jgi:hypothetical protein
MNQAQTNETHRAALALEIDARFETLIALLHGPIPMVIRNGSARLAQLYKEWALRVRKLTNEAPALPRSEESLARLDEAILQHRQIVRPNE